MMHLDWYWKYGVKHVSKPLVNHYENAMIDSFSMFKNKELLQWHMNKEILWMPRFNLHAILLPEGLQVNFKDKENNSYDYFIATQQKACNYGGSVTFFVCHTCNQRVRKLYCWVGWLLCRKCLKLGYYTQRLAPYERYWYMKDNIKKRLASAGGSIDKRPTGMKRKTFEKLRSKHFQYEYKEDMIYEKSISKCFSDAHNLD